MARAPEVFSLDPVAAAKPAKVQRPVTVVETEDAFATPPPTGDAELPARGSFWLRAFLSAAGGFLTLALTVWAYDLIVGLIAKWPPLGYLALGLAAFAAVALLVLLIREVVAIARLGSAARLRARADTAFISGARETARDFVGEIIAFYRKDAGTARAREALDGYRREIIDAPELVLLAERELLAGKDAEARAAIASAASRVAMVTTVSPRAWVDIAFVLAQSVRLISRLAAIYSGRPGGLAIWRLSARVASHLAITGGVAVAHDAIGQFLGAGLAGRLSSRLGEGVLNGVLTARVGLSAIAVCRPMPFRAFAPPALGDVAGSLLSARTEADKSAG